MNRVDAGRVVARLQAHYPSLASNDMAAQDWVNLVASYSIDQAELIAADLLTGWERDRAPRIADWQSVARQVAERRQYEEHRALEAPAVSRDDRVLELIAGMRDTLQSHSRRRCVCLGCARRRGEL